ncbi:MFS transporter [Nocardia asteroides]|uniref:Major facilitator superfamily transporter n=1 Tax=Nocardia asteroides NBRC 15531 TaxID=1110697 RepID=U5E3C5_NOCAS|nr:MFS transporter [Nocardia asteroides]TLF66676.1 MFS transporter [Nocardia asteroides NBRC 15531]UGT46219.1 MFS transporter [Nocardia asteroides]SFM98132.1 Sugar phosphate permease [Nocardia asteroides]VEG34983.1 Sialic acid permease [Nocardia asteroides]GAD82292.1 putative major facilitator superfamily transporter [Nocardia asteroides NBRC 15531]
MRRNRWIVLGGCFLAYLFDALEIVLLSMALPTIRADLGLTITQGGLLATATLVGIGVSSVLGGYVADNFGRKKALLASLATFGVFTAATAVVPSFAAFLLLRFLAGIGLGAVWSVVSAYVVESWPERSRGRAAAFVISAFPAGGAMAATISGWFLPDWRLMFLVAGTAVILPIVVVAVFFTESATWAAQKAGHADEVVSVRDVLGPTLRRRTLLGTLMAALALFGYWGAMTWLPTYLTTERGLPSTSVALFVTIVNLGMFAGYNGFGYLADHIGRHRTIVLTLLGVALTLPIYAMTTHQTALLWLGPLFGAFTAFFGLFGSYLGELFPTRARATGAGFCFNVGRGVSALAPFILAGLAGGIGFRGGLLVCAGFFGLAALVALLLPRADDVTPPIADPRDDAPARV